MSNHPAHAAGVALERRIGQPLASPVAWFAAGRRPSVLCVFMSHHRVESTHSHSFGFALRSGAAVDASRAVQASSALAAVLAATAADRVVFGT